MKYKVAENGNTQGKCKYVKIVFVQAEYFSKCTQLLSYQKNVFKES